MLLLSLYFITYIETQTKTVSKCLKPLRKNSNIYSMNCFNGLTSTSYPHFWGTAQEVGDLALAPGPEDKMYLSTVLDRSKEGKSLPSEKA